MYIWIIFYTSFLHNGGSLLTKRKIAVVLLKREIAWLQNMYGMGVCQLSVENKSSEDGWCKGAKRAFFYAVNYGHTHLVL